MLPGQSVVVQEDYSIALVSRIVLLRSWSSRACAHYKMANTREIGDHMIHEIMRKIVKSFHTNLSCTLAKRRWYPLARSDSKVRYEASSNTRFCRRSVDIKSGKVFAPSRTMFVTK
jgi:hypothetical protein